MHFCGNVERGQADVLHTIHKKDMSPKEDGTNMITIVDGFSGKEEVEAMVEILSSRNCSPRAGADAVNELKWNTKQDETDNPARVPMASKNPQACCRSLSSWTLATFPRCFSERKSTSAGVKYG